MEVACFCPLTTNALAAQNAAVVLDARAATQSSEVIHEGLTSYERSVIEDVALKQMYDVETEWQKQGLVENSKLNVSQCKTKWGGTSACIQVHMKRGIASQPLEDALAVDSH